MQNQQGGWRYKPYDGEAGRLGDDLPDQGLRSARNAGFHGAEEPSRQVHQVREELPRSQSGGFRYQPTAAARIRAHRRGIDALYSSGLYESKELEKALNYLKTFKPGGGNARAAASSATLKPKPLPLRPLLRSPRHVDAGGDYWKEWYPAIRNELLIPRRRRFLDDSAFGPEYATAMSLIICRFPPLSADFAALDFTVASFRLRTDRVAGEPAAATKAVPCVTRNAVPWGMVQKQAFLRCTSRVYMAMQRKEPGAICTENGTDLSANLAATLPSLVTVF